MRSIYNRTFEIVPMLLVAVLWYPVITSVLNIAQGHIERYNATGDRRSETATPAQSPAGIGDTA
ncbi:hypothetical protein [Paenirhodobacter populi]|uniref:hypothetical protein n=1 Tax=Paenirhodobacter populi TaxID=2306993 RepID=UPI0019D4CDEE|nr:hypothetical protein [Sinirhodobacter populi]